MASTSSSSCSENDDDNDHHDYHYDYEDHNNNSSNQKLVLERLKEQCATMVKTLKRLHQEEVSIRCQNKILAREIIHCGYRGRELPIGFLGDGTSFDIGGSNNNVKRSKKKISIPSTDITTEVADVIFSAISATINGIPSSTTEQPLSVKLEELVKMEDQSGETDGRFVTDPTLMDECGVDGDRDDNYVADRFVSREAQKKEEHE